MDHYRPCPGWTALSIVGDPCSTGLGGQRLLDGNGESLGPRYRVDRQDQIQHTYPKAQKNSENKKQSPKKIGKSENPKKKVQASILSLPMTASLFIAHRFYPPDGRRISILFLSTTAFLFIAHMVIPGRTTSIDTIFTTDCIHIHCPYVYPERGEEVKGEGNAAVGREPRPHG